MILLVHHGDAVGPEIDPQRPLSSHGRAVSERQALRVAALGVSPEAIWHSGKLRARQTAEPLWRACNPLASFEAVRGLQPGDPPGWIRDRLAGETRTIAVVGHMPHLGRLLRLLVAGSEDAPIPFPSHAIVALESRDDGTFTEAWRLFEPEDVS